MFARKGPMGKLHQIVEASEALSWEDTLENTLTLYHYTTLFIRGGQGGAVDVVACGGDSY
jgi:hypothetical protein